MICKFSFVVSMIVIQFMTYIDVRIIYQYNKMFANKYLLI